MHACMHDEIEIHGTWIQYRCVRPGTVDLGYYMYEEELEIWIPYFSLPEIPKYGLPLLPLYRMFGYEGMLWTHALKI